MADLVIPIRLDQTPAQAAAQAFRATLRQMHQGIAADARAAGAQELAATKQIIDSKKQAIAAATEGEIRSARRAHETEMGLTSEAARSLKSIKTGAIVDVTKAYEGMGASAQTGFNLASAGAVAVGAALTAGLRVARELSAVFDEVGRKQKAYADKFSSDRDKLREIASVEGRTADSAFTLETHRFGRDAGMPFGEAVDFRAGFANVGQAFKGTNISPEEYEQYQGLSAQNAVRTGASSQAAADFSGSFLADPGLKRFGAGAAEEALRRQYQVGQVYDAGIGSPTQNYGAFGALKKQFDSDPSLAKAYGSDVELATIGSVANAAGPDRQREQVEALTRDLRDDKNEKLNALKKKLGVTNDMTMLPMIQALAPGLMEQAKEEGRSLEQVISDVLPNMQSRAALAFQINEGIGKGGYAYRAKVAEKAGGAGIGEKSLADFKSSEVGMERRADAEIELAKAERASKDSDAFILRKQAIANLTRVGHLDTNAAGLNDFLVKKASFDLIAEPEQLRIDAEAERIGLGRVSEKARTRFADHGFGSATPEARTKSLGFLSRLGRDEGASPLVARPGEAAALAADRPELGGGWFDWMKEERFPERRKPAGPAKPDWGGGAGAGGGDWGPKAVEVLKDIKTELKTPSGPPVPLIEKPKVQKR